MCLALSGCGALKIGLGSALGTTAGFLIGGPPVAILGAAAGGMGGNVLAENDRLKDENAELRAASGKDLEILKRRADDAQRRLDSIPNAPKSDPHIFDSLGPIDTRRWWQKSFADIVREARKDK